MCPSRASLRRLGYSSLHPANTPPPLHLTILGTPPIQNLTVRLEHEPEGHFRRREPVGKIAILVDAGYLLAAGAELLHGGRDIKRHNLALDCDELYLLLAEAASMCEPSDDLLRVYWYDAAVGPDTLTDEQKRIADKRNSKLRLGTLNHYGGQKGVDTLMVMDVLALSRNKAVASLLVVTGDDDLRPALEKAQEFGVRVHLLGVQPARGANQAERLKRECDSTREWGKLEIATFLSIADGSGDKTAAAGNGTATLRPTEARLSEALADALQDALERATTAELQHILANSSSDFVGIPASVDGPLLRRYGNNLGRSLSEDEKKIMRRQLYERVRALGLK